MKKNSPDFVKDYNKRNFLKQCLCLSCCGFWSLLNSNNSKIAIAQNILPDLGDIDRTKINDNEFHELGNNIINQLQFNNKILDDYDILYYLNQLGNSLAYKYSARKKYSFLLIKDNQVNAFALPGNYVCLHQGLIHTTESEAEIVSVISHELAHLIQHHIFRNVSISNRNQLLAMATTISGALLSPFSPITGMVLLNTGQAGSIQNMLYFSREFEKEADRVGQKIMYNSNFDPFAMPAFFARMQQINQFNNNNDIAFLQTHPVTLERLSEAYARAKQLKVKHYMRPDSISFLLIKEKCRINILGPKQAIIFYQTVISDKRYNNINIQFYGLALSYFLLGNSVKSVFYINKINNHEINYHYVILNLKIKQQIFIKNYNTAIKILEQSHNLYSDNISFYYQHINLLIEIKKYREAKKIIKHCQEVYPDNVKIWQLNSILYSNNNINNNLYYHYSLAKMIASKGNIKDAIDQYQQALKYIKSGDNSMKYLINREILQLKQRNI